MVYDELFIGVGQHPIHYKLKKELDLTKIKLKYFGNLVYKNKLPIYPINPKYKINIKDLPLEILTNYN